MTQLSRGKLENGSAGRYCGAYEAVLLAGLSGVCVDAIPVHPDWNLLWIHAEETKHRVGVPDGWEDNVGVSDCALVDC